MYTQPAQHIKFFAQHIFRMSFVCNAAARVVDVRQSWRAACPPETPLPHILMAPWQQCTMEMRKQAADKEALKTPVTPALVYKPAGFVCLILDMAAPSTITKDVFILCRRLTAWSNERRSHISVAEKCNQFGYINCTVILKMFSALQFKSPSVKHFFFSLCLWFHYIRMPKRQIALQNSW